MSAILIFSEFVPAFSACDSRFALIFIFVLDDCGVVCGAGLGAGQKRKSIVRIGESRRV